VISRDAVDVAVHLDLVEHLARVARVLADPPQVAGAQLGHANPSNALRQPGCAQPCALVGTFTEIGRVRQLASVQRNHEVPVSSDRPA
jgi:hypothetical protein